MTKYEGNMIKYVGTKSPRVLKMSTLRKMAGDKCILKKQKDFDLMLKVQTTKDNFLRKLNHAPLSDS